MKRVLVLFMTVLVAFFCRAQDAGSAASGASVEGAVFFVKTDAGSGLAFLVEGPNGGTWMISCNSVFQGTDEYLIMNAFGHAVTFPEQVMVARNRDLILFPTDRPAGLLRAESCEYDEQLLAFSKCVSDSEDYMIHRLEDELREVEKNRSDYDDANEVIKELDEMISALKAEKSERMQAKENAEKLKKGYLLAGKVVAPGVENVEVSALFTSEDSGGPVVNKDREVIGVSSHLLKGSGLPSWVTEGTRFADTRRFALKIDGAQWMPMTRKEYERQGRFVQETFDSLATFAAITEMIDDDFFREITIETDNRDVQKWIKVHNKAVEEYKDAVKGVYYSQKEVDKAVRGIERKVDKDFEALVTMVGELEKDSGRIHRVTIPHVQEELTDVEELYRAIRVRLERIAETR